jgi:uncharacterized protein HemX
MSENIDVQKAYDKGYNTALESVSFYIMSNFDVNEPNMTSIMKYINELREEEEDDE